MGMLVEGVWENNTDQFMQDGVFKRETSLMPTQFSADILKRISETRAEFVLVASSSCPWSHGTVLASVIKGLSKQLPLQRAGGPRIEGYALLPDGVLSQEERIRHAHQLYTLTDPSFTGRVTVPVLWDLNNSKIISNSSTDIIWILNNAAAGIDLCPSNQRCEIRELTQTIFDGLSNAVYRAGLAELQNEYDDAVKCVFDTMAMLEQRLSDRTFLFGSQITEADIRLFATLVRFDTVYATHFRCTYKRLIDYSALWRFTRRIFQMPGIKETINFDEIRYGYYVNDGNHNPFGIISRQPHIDWEMTIDF